MGWFSQLLGEVRNLDVLTLRITLHTEPDADPVALESLYGAVAMQRSDVTFRLAYARAMPRVRDRPQPRRPARRRGAAAHRPREGRPTNGDGPVSASAVAQRPGRRTRRSAASPTEAHLHTLRIRSKELRYASELAAGVFGRHAARPRERRRRRSRTASAITVTRSPLRRSSPGRQRALRVRLHRRPARRHRAARRGAFVAGSRQRPRRPEAALEGLRPVAGRRRRRGVHTTRRFTGRGIPAGPP